LIAVDTNILVYAHRRDSKWHRPAAASVRSLAEGMASWTIAWPCLHEFIAIATHNRVYVPPSTLDEALSQVEKWMASPTLQLIAEGETHWEELKAVARNGKIVGPQIHDARVAAICLQHGVSELWTADRDFTRFPALTIRNPLVARVSPRGSLLAES
jgi:toxin-antitoxin system PIN domain toxin